MYSTGKTLFFTPFLELESPALVQNQLTFSGSSDMLDEGRRRVDMLLSSIRFEDTALGHVSFIEEKISGTVSWHKRQIAAILEQAQEGDTIIVSELSRLGRSMLECMEILSRNAEGRSRLRRERQLATQQQHPEQDRRDGFCHGRRN